MNKDLSTAKIEHKIKATWSRSRAHLVNSVRTFVFVRTSVASISRGVPVQSGVVYIHIIHLS